MKMMFIHQPEEDDPTVSEQDCIADRRSGYPADCHPVPKNNLA